MDDLLLNLRTGNVGREVNNPPYDPPPPLHPSTSYRIAAQPLSFKRPDEKFFFSTENSHFASFDLHLFSESAPNATTMKE